MTISCQEGFPTLRDAKVVLESVEVSTYMSLFVSFEHSVGDVFVIGVEEIHDIFRMLYPGFGLSALNHMRIILVMISF